MVLGFFFLLLVFLLPAILITGAIWTSSVMLPFLVEITGILTFISIFIFIPLLFFRETRIWGGNALLFASWIFGITV